MQRKSSQSPLLLSAHRGQVQSCPDTKVPPELQGLARDGPVFTGKLHVLSPTRRLSFVVEVLCGRLCYSAWESRQGQPLLVLVQMHTFPAVSRPLWLHPC